MKIELDWSHIVSVVAASGGLFVWLQKRVAEKNKQAEDAMLTTIQNLKKDRDRYYTELREREKTINEQHQKIRELQEKLQEKGELH